MPYPLCAGVKALKKHKVTGNQSSRLSMCCILISFVIKLMTVLLLGYTVRLMQCLCWHSFLHCSISALEGNIGWQAGKNRWFSENPVLLVREVWKYSVWFGSEDTSTHFCFITAQFLTSLHRTCLHGPYREQLRLWRQAMVANYK